MFGRQYAMALDSGELAKEKIVLAVRGFMVVDGSPVMLLGTMIRIDELFHHLYL